MRSRPVNARASRISVHRGLGAGHGHARHVDPAGQLADELDRADLVLARQAEADALAHPLVDVVVDARVAVAEDDRSVAHPQVDELVAVGIPDEPALAAIDVDRVVAPRSEVRVRAAGQSLRRAPIQRQLAVATDVRDDVSGGGLSGHADPRVARSGGARTVGRALRDTGRAGAHRATRPERASTRHSSACGARATKSVARCDGPTNHATFPVEGDETCDHPAVTEPISYWLRDSPPDGTADPPLAAGEHAVVDVAIIGAGFTGLWTAIALTDTDPALHVAVLEMETVGFGASGRNGGLLRGQPDPRARERDPAFPRRARPARAGGARQPRRSDRLHARPRRRLRSRGDRRAGAGRPGVAGRRVPGVGRRGGRARRASRVPGPRCRAGGGPLAALARRASIARPAATSSSTRPGCAAASPASRANAGCASTSARG